MRPTEARCSKDNSNQLWWEGFFMVGAVQHWHKMPRDAVASPSREIIKHSPEQLDLTLKLSLVLVGLDGITSRDPFQTELLY